MGSCRWTNTRYEKSGISRNRLFLAFYGTEREKLPSPGTQQRIGILRKELKLTSDDILVGMVAYMYAPKRFLGQRHGLKGHEDFIDAIAMLREDNPKIHGVCVGGAYNEKSKWYEEQVRKYAHKKCPDGMFFTGTRSDVFDIYPDFDLAVHPSHSENLGGAIQSLLMGIPTIASEVGGFPDIVIPGETGLLIPPKNPNAIAEAIKEGLDNIEKMRKMALNGQTMICEGFTADVTTLAVLEAYKVILRK